MQKEESNIDSYEYVFLGDKNNTFAFITVNKIVYEVTFKDSDYLFANNEELKNNTFEISILVAENPTKRTPPLDKLIPKTIANIVADFFQNHERVVLYICDSSDSREAARARKFGHWFSYFSEGQYLRVETTIKDELLAAIYFVSVIIRRDNPSKSLIFNEFDKLTSPYQQK